MLYVQKGLKTHDMRTAKKGLKELLSTWNPSRISLTDTNLEDYKHSRAFFGFSGDLKDNIRNDDNVLYRDAIARHKRQKHL